MPPANRAGDPLSGVRPDLVAKLDLRRRTRRRVLLRRTAIAVGVLAVAAGLVWLVAFSSVLETREVAVRGNELTTPEQVVEAAQVPLGTPLVRIPGNAIRQRVLALAPVADVKLHREWPNLLVIEVIERTLVYQRLYNGSYQWVDATGRVFHVLDERSPGVVAVTDSDDHRILADLATVVSALPIEVVDQVERIDAPTIDSIVVLLTDGRSIVWGNADRSAEKAALLPTLLAMPGSVFDVSVPSHPAVR